MLRQSIHQAAGRTRPDLQRVAEGIAATQRSFSVARALCAEDGRSRPTGRARSAAAANEIAAMSDNSLKPATRSQRGERAAPSQRSTSATAEGPKIIRVMSLRGGTGGRFTGAARGGLSLDNSFSRAPADEKNSWDRNSAFSASPRPGGSLRGRGGGSFGDRGGGGRGGRGGVRGRGRGRRDDDDRDGRPTRRRQAKEEENEPETAAFRIFMAKDVGDPEVVMHERDLAEGVVSQFNPVPSSEMLKDLTGYMPAVATFGTPLAHASTVMTQARRLGGAQAAWNPGAVQDPREARKMYEKGVGAFFVSEEQKDWSEEYFREEKGFKFAPAPEETKTAVLESSLVGQYAAPKFADNKDTISVVEKYTKQDWRWHPRAEHSVAEKVAALIAAKSGNAAGANTKAAQRAKKA